MDDLAHHILAVARALWGEPRPHGTRTETRFGEGRTICLDKGTWYSHADSKGGGVLDLVIHERRAADRRGAIEWMREQGYPIEDRPQHVNGSAYGGASERAATATPSRHESPSSAPQNAAKSKPDDGAKREPVQSWSYVDEAGAVLYQTARSHWRLPDGTFRVGADGKPEKTFSQRRRARDGEESRDGWVYSLKGTRIVPYRLPELIEAVASDYVVWHVEGEKCADKLASLGIPATCNPMGAGKWWDDLTPHFQGARVVILPDNDESGRKHAELVAGKLRGVAADIRVLALPGLPPKGDAFDWIEAGGTAEQLYELAASAPKADAPRFASRFGALPWRDIDTPGPEHDYLIDDFLTAGDKSVIGGPSKSGKSFLSIHAGLAIARGVEFFGRKVKRGLVVYQAGEGARGVKKRLRAYRRHFNVARDEDIPFVLLQSRIDLHSPEGDTAPLIAEIKAIQALYPDHPLRMVVIDTLATAQGGADENSGRDMGAVMGNVDRLSRECGAHVCLVHHLNANGNKLRGHTSIYANIDQVITVVRDDETKVRTVTLDKQKDDPDGITVRFELQSVEIGAREDGRPITSCVVVGTGEKAKQKAEDSAMRGWKVRDGEREFLVALAEAIERKGISPPADLNLHERVVTVASAEDVRAIYWEKFATTESGDADEVEARLKQRWGRATKGLLRFALIGAKKPHIWFTGKEIQGFRLRGIREPEPRFHVNGRADDERAAHADAAFRDAPLDPLLEVPE
jgi:hypothetical protein